MCTDGSLPPPSVLCQQRGKWATQAFQAQTSTSGVARFVVVMANQPGETTELSAAMTAFVIAPVGASFTSVAG